MGSYTFRWEHPAQEVFVTGTFDSWAKSIKLDKTDVVHEKTIALPNTDDKILYKFVADGEWKHDHTGKTETDPAGNINNVIYPEDIKPPSSAAQPIPTADSGASTTESASEPLPSAAGHTLSSVGPGATTTEMAGEQPKEQTSSAPGAFPETPAADDNQTFSVNPIPASEGANNPIHLEPGEKVPDPSTINDNTVSSTAHDDEELKSKDQEGEKEKEQSLWIAPIPATGGIGNPVQLAPGEKVPDPSTFTDNTVESTVKHDRESYEKSDAMPPSSGPAGPGTLADRVSPAEGVFGNVSGPGPVIPESGMAMGESRDITQEDTGPTISSVAPGSTTNELAGQQPIEPRGVPEVVTESQQEAKVDPEASASPEAVEEKKSVEEELLKKVHEEPSTAESGADGKSEDKSEEGIGAKTAAGVAVAGTAAAGAAVAANEMAKDKTGEDPKAAMPETVQNTVNEKAQESEIPEKAADENTTATGGSIWGPAGTTTATTADIGAADESTADAARETATSVPQEVAASQREAGEEPEAAANTEAVAEKSEVEKELLSKVPESEAQGEPAPTYSAAKVSMAPAATTSSTSASGAPQLEDPTAGVAALSMDDNKVAESSEGGLNADKDAEAQPPVPALAPEESKPSAPALAPEESKSPMDSRDVSPMSKPVGGEAQPLVTTGVGSSSTPSKNGAAASGPQKRNSIIEKLKSYPDNSPKKSETSSTPSSSTSKKEKRRSFFGKIKDKLKS